MEIASELFLENLFWTFLEIWKILDNLEIWKFLEFLEIFRNF
jgi:hypothetical protein